MRSCGECVRHLRLRPARAACTPTSSSRPRPRAGVRARVRPAASTTSWVTSSAPRWSSSARRPKARRSRSATWSRRLPIALTATGIEPVGAYSNIYNGGYAELMRLTAGMCMKVPNGLDHRAGPRSPSRWRSGRHAVARRRVDACRCGGRARRGAGRAGGRRRAARIGIETIVVCDFSPAPASVALAMGATEAVDPASDDPIDAWQRVDGRRAPVVFDAIGVPGTLELADRARAGDVARRASWARACRPTRSGRCSRRRSSSRSCSRSPTTRSSSPTRCGRSPRARST